MYRLLTPACVPFAPSYLTIGESVFETILNHIKRISECFIQNNNSNNNNKWKNKKIYIFLLYVTFVDFCRCLCASERASKQMSADCINSRMSTVVFLCFAWNDIRVCLALGSMNKQQKIYTLCNLKESQIKRTQRNNVNDLQMIVYFFSLSC